MDVARRETPPQYAFVIDHRKCIGCHACTVACKAENEVPLGKFRTWVKYTEKGVFPEVRRHFTVLRCNHCDAAPCVEICPVTALSKRPDAIVDLDRSQCIGCRACMQACPYDALYFHEDDGVAEKCHYCAHRTDVGLEPACVIVCPVQAIVAGDASDPETPIGRLVREEKTSRRRLEKGTQPRVWYIDALPESLTPGAAAEPSQYLWSDRSKEDVAPPVVPGYEPTPDVTATLDVPHPPAWGWHVWLYLVTKNIAAGAALVAPFLAMLGARAGFVRDFLPEAVSLAFMAITSLLLVHDLGRPERAWKILFQPNTRSWLVKGAWVLSAFGALSVSVIVHRLVGLERAAEVIRWANVPIAALAAGYSAFLFKQCRGRDLWLEPGLFTSLVVRAALLGATFALVLPRSLALPGLAPESLVAVLSLATAALMSAELRSRGRTAEAAKSIALMGSKLTGVRPPLMLLGVAALALGLRLGGSHLGDAVLPLRVLAAVQVVIALTLFERAWIRAGQEVPIS